MNNYQRGILAEETRSARFLVFNVVQMAELGKTLRVFASRFDVTRSVAGIGQSLVAALGSSIPGLRTFPAIATSALQVPSTPAALWCWLRGDDRGELFHRSRHIESLLQPNFRLDNVIDCFQYDQNRDLTGYIDGTENPKKQAAIDAAIVGGEGIGLDGSSFVAVQQWVHDLDCFESMSGDEQDNTFGRHRSNNEEFDEAPESAHVKRAAQESFDPEAFILRRSMPWVDGTRAGLNFVAFGKSFNAYEAILNRMVGAEDGIQDALFGFTRPVSGAYFWCPPAINEQLDLTALGIAQSK